MNNISSPSPAGLSSWGQPKVLLILDHPWSESYNFAIASHLKNELECVGAEVDMLDLERDNFDPVLRQNELAVYTRGEFLDPKVDEYQRRIKNAQYLVFVFPIWWAAMPAMLKGFADKVFLPGWAFRESDACPLLTHIRQAVVVTTMGAPEGGICTVDQTFCRAVLEFCGVQQWKWLNITDVSNVSDGQRKSFMSETASYCRKMVE